MKDETDIQESSINQESNSTMSVTLCTGVTLVKKNYCLVTRIVSFVTASTNLLTFHILEPYPSKDIALHLNDIFSH